jgi:hypothetical protein
MDRGKPYGKIAVTYKLAHEDRSDFLFTHNLVAVRVMFSAFWPRVPLSWRWF